MTAVERWLAALGAPSAGEAATAAYRDLIARYEEPHRVYHDVRHLEDVLGLVDELAGEAEDADAVRLAAWFHDAVYEISVGGNEEASARLAEQVLTRLGFAPARVEEVARLVRLTEKHTAEDGDRNASVLFDADLAILAAPPERYRQYASAVRAEYRAIPDAVFRPARARILGSLLDAPALYRTVSARARFEDRARANVAEEIAELTR